MNFQNNNLFRFSLLLSVRFRYHFSVKPVFRSFFGKMKSIKKQPQIMKTLLKNTIFNLCKNGLSFEKRLKIQGLLAVSVDSEVFVVQMDEKFIYSPDGKILENNDKKKNSTNFVTAFDDTSTDDPTEEVTDNNLISDQVTPNDLPSFPLEPLPSSLTEFVDSQKNDNVDFSERIKAEVVEDNDDVCDSDRSNNDKWGIINIKNEIETKKTVEEVTDQNNFSDDFSNQLTSNNIVPISTFPTYLNTIETSYGSMNNFNGTEANHIYSPNNKTECDSSFPFVDVKFKFDELQDNTSQLFLNQTTPCIKNDLTFSTSQCDFKHSPSLYSKRSVKNNQKSSIKKDVFTYNEKGERVKSFVCQYTDCTKVCF